MESNYSSKNLFIYSLIFYLLLIFTNQYPSLETSIHMGFHDQLMYLKLFNVAPYFPSEGIRPHQAARFFSPYLIGTICEFIQIKNHIYPVLISINIFINLLIIQLFIKITSHFNVARNINLILISALIFNAYNFRVSLYAPLMLNDILFTYGLLLIVFFFIKKKVSYFYIGLILCCLTRQTSLILNLLFFIIIFHKIFFKTNTKIGKFINGIIINFSIFFILRNISLNFSTDDISFLVSHISAIFTFDYRFIDLLNIFSRLLIANIFIFMLSALFIVKFNFYKKMINFELIKIFFLASFIWIQPILGSPIVGTNISRLTIISMPIFLVLFSIIFKDLKIKFLHSIIIIILIFLSSLHHHYTYIFNLFFKFNNYQFGIITLLLHTIIFILFLKNYSKEFNKKVE